MSFILWEGSFCGLQLHNSWCFLFYFTIALPFLLRYSFAQSTTGPSLAVTYIELAGNTTTNRRRHVTGRNKASSCVRWFQAVKPCHRPVGHPYDHTVSFQPDLILLLSWACLYGHWPPILDHKKFWIGCGVQRMRVWVGVDISINSPIPEGFLIRSRMEEREVK